VEIVLKTVHISVGEVRSEKYVMSIRKSRQTLSGGYGEETMTKKATS